MHKVPVRRLAVQASVLLVLLLTAAFIWTRVSGKEAGLQYVYDESVFHQFTVDGSGYVTFNCDITVRNTTESDVRFTMKADVSEDLGLTAENTAFAYENGSDHIEVFAIAPNAQQTYQVTFKAPSGDKKSKTDRNPPDAVVLTPQ